MTKASRPSSNLASLVWGGQEQGGGLSGTMGAAFGGKPACGLMQRRAEQSLQPNQTAIHSRSS